MSCKNSNISSLKIQKQYFIRNNLILARLLRENGIDPRNLSGRADSRNDTRGRSKSRRYFDVRTELFCTRDLREPTRFPHPRVPDISPCRFLRDKALLLLIYLFIHYTLGRIVESPMPRGDHYSPANNKSRQPATSASMADIDTPGR